jgi:hypothetical protein
VPGRLLYHCPFVGQGAVPVDDKLAAADVAARGSGGRKIACCEFGIILLLGLVRPGLRLTVPCFLLLVVLLFPRVALVLMWLFSTYLQRAFHGGLVLPVLGFIFLPLTTIVYAWELNSGMPTAGINLLWLLVAVIIDLGGLGGGAHLQSRR